MRNFKLFIPFFFSFVASVYGQNQPPVPKIAFNDSLVEGRDYFIVYDTIGNAGPNIVATSVGSSEISVIVEFKDEPAAKSKIQNKEAASSRILSAKSKIQSRIDQLQDDLDRLSAGTASGHSRKSSSARIKRSYYKVFSGAQVHISESLEKEIKALPYVRNVYRDQQVKITLNESVSMINADKIRQDYGVYGEGIKVGIIDTGIDYNHPDLGGGFGEGFKVAGGYDFVNDDDDPMDDHSHGTHVAGIVAADGESIRGVAPEATLYALKALSEVGFGYNSDIIAAIEWSVDPNNDGNPDDKLDVVNMSLAGTGNSDDPMSVAVDNAVSMGVTYCIAAGNNWDYYTIGSPGTARKAITVGSIDKSGQVSFFSSRGPTQKNFLIKPDIMAPGGEIQSTVPGGGYEYKSGTSMASPHVAGAAALVLNLHPEWGPKEIKNAVMQTAKKIEGKSVFDQGKGLIDLKALAESESLVSPGSISLGIISAENGIWTKTDTVFVENKSNEIQLYGIAAHNQPDGLEIFFKQVTLELAPGETGYFEYTATIDPSEVTLPNVESPDYGREITITNGMANYRIPYAFMVGNVLSLQFNVNPIIVVIHDQKEQRFVFNGIGNSLELPFASGNYDILVYFPGNRIVLKENIALNGDFRQEIKDTEASHVVTMKGLDVDGNETRVLEAGYWSLSHKQSGMGFNVHSIVALVGEPPKFSKRYFSNISDNYEFQCNLRSKATWNDKRHFYNFPVFINDGINQSFTHHNDPDEFVKLVYELPFPDKEQKLFYTKDFSTPGRSYSYDVQDASNVLSYPFKIEEYLLPIPHENFISNLYVRHKIYLLNTNSDDFDPEVDSLLATTAHVAVLPSSDKIGFWKRNFWDLKWNLQGITKNSDRGYTKVKLFSAPTHYHPTFGPADEGIQFWKEMPAFYDAFNNMRTGKIAYKVSDESNSTIYEGVADNATNSQSSVFLPLSPEKKYKLNYSFNGYVVGNKISEAIVSYDFSPEPSHIPSISYLNTYASGNLTNLFSANEPIDIIFDPIYPSSLTAAKLYYQKEGQSDWIEVSTKLFQDEFGTVRNKGTINGNLAPGYYSLKITNEINNIQLINRPAFLIQSNYTSDSLALAEFYHSTNGSEWTNKQGWLQSSNLADWYGVTVQDGKVVAIDLAENNLSGRVLKNFSKLTGLQRLILKNNSVEVLGDLSEMDNLVHLDVSDNKLNFQDLAPNSFVENYVYAPQDSIGLNFVHEKTTGQRLELIAFDKNPGNKFSWIKDEKLIDLAPDSSKLVIDSLTLTDAGKYHCQITNELLPELQLYSKVQEVNVLPADFRSLTHWEFLRGSNNSTGVNWIDYDGDGNLDLFVVGFNNRNKLVRSDDGNGDIQFKEVTISGITDNVDYYYGSSWGDYNNDGFIDFYLITNRASSKNYLLLNTDGNFNIDKNSPQLNNYFNRSLGASWGDYNNDGLLDLFIANSTWSQHETAGSKLFRNSVSNILTPSNAIVFFGSGRFSSWSDYDNDGDLDLFIGDYINTIFKNDEGAFSRLTLKTGNGFVEVKGASWGDCDNDGDLDLFVTNGSMYGQAYGNSNKFYQNQGNGVLNLVQDYELTKNNNGSYGSAWGDYDNDGDLDLFVANFYGKNELWQNQLIETGVLDFVQIKNGEIVNTYEASTAAAWGDYDGDGDLDLFVANYQDDNYFYENLHQGNNWINILCKGIFTNSSAIGTKVRLKATINGKDHWQLREISAQTGFAAQNSLNVEFGLGDANLIDSLIVDWLGSGKQILTNIEPNQFIVLQEPNLFRFPIEHQRMSQNDVIQVSIEALYSGNQDLIFLVNSDPEKVRSSIEGNLLKIESGSWVGNDTVEVSITDGQKTYIISFNVEVYDKSLVIGVQDPSQELNVNLYPNPSNGNITLAVKQNENFSLHFEIFNSLGKKVFQQKVKNTGSESSRQFPLNQLTPGVYIAKILINDKLLTKRIIIE